MCRRSLMNSLVVGDPICWFVEYRYFLDSDSQASFHQIWNSAPTDLVHIHKLRNKVCLMRSYGKEWWSCTRWLCVRNIPFKFLVWKLKKHPLILVTLQIHTFTNSLSIYHYTQTFQNHPRILHSHCFVMLYQPAN